MKKEQLRVKSTLYILVLCGCLCAADTGVIYSHILGFLIFDEKLTASTLAGGMLIFVGVLMVTVRSSSSSSSSSSSATRGKADTSAASDGNNGDMSQTAEVEAAESQALLAGVGRKQDLRSEHAVQLGRISIDIGSGTDGRVTEGQQQTAYAHQQEQQQQQHVGGLLQPPWLQQLLGRDTSGGAGAVGGSSDRSTDQVQDISWCGSHISAQQQPGSASRAAATAAAAAGAAAATQDDFGPFALQRETGTSQHPAGGAVVAAGAAAQQQGDAAVAQMLHHAQDVKQLAAGAALGVGIGPVAMTSGVGDDGASADPTAEQLPMLRVSHEASWASWPSLSSAAGGSVELLASAQLQLPEQHTLHSPQQKQQMLQ
jgi:hypothetical protein